MKKGHHPIGNLGNYAHPPKSQTASASPKLAHGHTPTPKAHKGASGKR